MENITTFIEEINSFLVSLNPFGAVMITDNKNNTTRIVDQFRGNYYSAALSIAAIFMENVRDNDNPPDFDMCANARELWQTCIEDKDFGNIFGLYIQDKNFNFIRVYYD